MGCPAEAVLELPVEIGHVADAYLLCYLYHSPIGIRKQVGSFSHLLCSLDFGKCLASLALDEIAEIVLAVSKLARQHLQCAFCIMPFDEAKDVRHLALTPGNSFRSSRLLVQTANQFQKKACDVASYEFCGIQVRKIVNGLGFAA